MTTATMDDVRDALRHQPLVKEFTPSQVERLSRLAEWIEFEPGEVIHREGDECSLLYLVVSGHVAIELPGALPESPVRLDSLSGRITWNLAADRLEVGGGGLAQRQGHSPAPATWTPLRSMPRMV